MKNSQQNQDEFIRKRMERKRRRKKRRLIAWFIFMLCLLLAVGVTLCLTVFFPIKNISVSGSKLYTQEEIIKASQIKLEDNLFALSEKQLEARLMSKLPYIEKIELMRSLPDTLKIKVTDAKEYSCCLVKGKYYILSKEGWVLSSCKEKPENVFEMRIESAECKVGSRAVFKDEDAYKLCSKIISELENADISIDFIDVTDSVALTANVEGRFSVNFGTSNNLEEKIKHLNGMLDSIAEEESGSINLSMWSSEKKQGTYVKNNE